MARKNRNTFLKRQKEIERMRKAREKMARRQGKKAKTAIDELEGAPENSAAHGAEDEVSEPAAGPAAEPAAS